MTHPTWGQNTLVGIEQITSQRSGETFSIDDAIASTNGLPRFRLDNDNVINGTNGDDNIQGGADVQGFYGGTGNDVYFGTDAFEQVNYDGARAEYNITQNNDGSITVDHPIWGTDTLIDIDGLIFTGVEPGVGGARTAEFEFISTDDLFAGKRVALFAVPGAFTPTCSAQHLPSFIENADALKSAGVDSIACLSVNDAFVMGAWGDAQNASEIVMVADGNAEFTDAMGLTLDATGFGMGQRSQRYAMLIDDLTVSILKLEPGKGLDQSKAENLLALL